MSLVKLKVCKNGIFLAKNLFKKIYLVHLCPPIKVLWKIGPKGHLNGFLKGRALSIPPNLSHFQRPVMVGLRRILGTLSQILQFSKALFALNVPHLSNWKVDTVSWYFISEEFSNHYQENRLQHFSRLKMKLTKL